MNWRQIRKWFSILALTVTLMVLFVAWGVGGRLVAPANRVVGDPPSDFPAVTVQISSESGAELVGWYLPVPDSRATAILLHPIRGDRRSMLSRGKLFRKHGYSTLMIDLQAHGESHGENITIGHLEKLDVHAAVEFVRQRDAAQKIAIIGCSLGGASTVLANPDVEVMVLESIYPTVTEAVHNRVQMRLGPLHHVIAPLLLVQLHPRLGVSAGQLCPIVELSKVHCPVLIASGDQDEHTTIDETRELFEAANELKQLVVFEGAAHIDLLDYSPEKYEDEVVAFVDQVIGERVAVAEVKQ